MEVSKAQPCLATALTNHQAYPSLMRNANQPTHPPTSTIPYHTINHYHITDRLLLLQHEPSSLHSVQTLPLVNFHVSADATLLATDRASILIPTTTSMTRLSCLPVPATHRFHVHKHITQRYGALIRRHVGFLTRPEPKRACGRLLIDDKVHALTRLPYVRSSLFSPITCSVLVDDRHTRPEFISSSGSSQASMLVLRTVLAD